MKAVDTTGVERGTPPAHSRRFARRVVATVSILIVVTAAAAWLLRSDEFPLELGRPVDSARAIGVKDALTREVLPSGQAAVIRGRIGEVCRSAGCWFVLQEVESGRIHEILVDLKRRADFRIGVEVSGRTAIAAGQIVSDESNRVLEATGVRIE